MIEPRGFGTAEIPILESRSVYFGLSDLKRLVLRHRSFFKRVGIFCALAVFTVFLLREPKFESCATFKQSASKNEGVSDFTNLIKQVIVQESDSSAIGILASQSLLRQVVKEMGMQIEVRHRSLPARFFSRIGDNLLAEMGCALSDPDPFVFSKVAYEEEKASHFYIRISDAENYTLYDEKKNALAAGKIGEVLLFSKVQFALDKAPRNVSHTKYYPLTVQPWPDITKKLIKQIELKPSRVDGHLLFLRFFHRDRHLASRFLNQLMASYQHYLKEENEQTAQLQLAYLNKRQQELASNLEHALREHASYLKANLGEKGFVGLDQEIEMLAVPKEAYLSKMYDIDLELKRMEASKNMYAAEPSFHPQLATLRTGLSAGFARPDFASIDLDKAHHFYENYHEQLDKLQSDLKQLAFLSERIQDPSFELSSICSVLTDAVTQDMVKEAGHLALKLHDEGNRSAKELERTTETLATQKKFIAQHLSQTIELYKMRIHLVQSRIAALQNTSIGLLKNEKALVQNKLEELRLRMDDLPEKWLLENQLKLKKDLCMGMIEGMTHLVESKNINHHLYQVESKPLDPAIASLKPLPPRILLSSLIAACIGIGIAFAYQFLRGLNKGFPATEQSLKAHGMNVAGPLGPYCNCPLAELSDKDLETLRNAAAFISSHDTKCIALLGMKSFDYAPNLAGLLSLKGYKVLVIHCAFDQIIKPDHIPGLWHYLEDKAALQTLTRQSASHDVIPSGGTTRHTAELLSRPSFSHLISELQAQYEVLLLASNASPVSSEARVLLTQSNAAVLSLSEEPLDALFPIKAASPSLLFINSI